MANGDDQNLDINDWIRKNQILRNMPNVTGQQPDPSSAAGSVNYQPLSTVAGSTSYQPPSRNLPPISMPEIPEPPSSEAYNQAAQNLQNLGAPPQARDFHRNKLLTALVAPLMIKQMVRNPQQASENLNFLTRKGYGAAEEAYAVKQQQAERNYKIQSELQNQALKNFADKLNASKSRVDLERAVGEYNNWASGLDEEHQLKAAQLGEAQARAVNLKSPHIDTDKLFQVAYTDPDGKNPRTTTGYVRTFPDGSPHDYVDAATAKPIQNRTGVTEIPSATAALDERKMLLADAIKQFQIANKGKSPEGKDLEKIVSHIGEVISKPITERAEMTANREKFMLVAKDFEAKANSIAKPIDLELGSLRQLDSSLAAATRDPKSAANGVAANLAVVEIATAMSGGMRPISRYNKAEIDRILSAAGGIEGIRTAIDHWISTGSLASGVPQETLKQMKELSDIVKKELRWQQKTVNKYKTMLGHAKPESDDIGNLGERLDDELDAGPPMSLEDAAKARGIIK